MSNMRLTSLQSAQRAAPQPPAQPPAAAADRIQNVWGYIWSPSRVGAVGVSSQGGMWVRVIRISSCEMVLSCHGPSGVSMGALQKTSARPGKPAGRPLHPGIYRLVFTLRWCRQIDAMMRVLLHIILHHLTFTLMWTGGDFKGFSAWIIKSLDARRLGRN